MKQYLDRECYVGIVFVDFRKTFDMVSHSLLLQFMNEIGVRGLANDWFSSNLTNKVVSLKVQNEISPPLTLRGEVPQRIIYQPLLYPFYIKSIA